MTSRLTAEATRIAAGDDRIRYDAFAMTLHWLTFLLVLLLFGLAQFWGFLAKATPLREQMIVTHMSFGILLTVVLVVRIAWRLTPGHRVQDVTTGSAELALKLVHCLLYGLMIAQVVLGFILRWSGDEAMSFFGLQIAPPFAPFSKSAHELVGDAHHWIAWSIIILAAGHAAAALFHHFILRDKVLWRMMPGLHAGSAKARSPDARAVSDKTDGAYPARR
jgi:cytochrome b561